MSSKWIVVISQDYGGDAYEFDDEADARVHFDSLKLKYSRKIYLAEVKEEKQ